MIKVIIASSIMIYFVLLVILVLNIEEKSKIIKYSFLLFMLALMISLFFVNELIMDYLISIIVRYLYFPTFSSIIATIFITMFIFVFNVFNDSKKDKNRIINYIFASFIFVAYIIFMLLDIDINSYNDLYSGNSLLCLKYISRTFVIWMIINGLIKYYRYFIRKR